MDLKPSMLLDERKAVGLGDMTKIRSGAAVSPMACMRPRVALFASPRVAEILAASTQFEFIVYGPPDGAVLSGIRPFDIDAILVHFEPGCRNVSDIMDVAGNFFLDLPSFVLCHLQDQKEVSQFAWQLIATRDLTVLPEIEDKLHRALFLFPWMRCGVLRKILASLKTIPGEAASHQSIVKELQNPQYNLQEVARMIKHDPSLTAQLLKIANSAAFSRSVPVVSVDDAISMLGAVKLQALITSAWAFFMIDDAACAGFNPRHEWQHAVEIAERVRQMCATKKLSAEIAETAIIAALLHDLGKLLLAANLSRDYTRVLESVELDKRPLWQVENQMLGFNHAEVAGCLLGIWGVPLPVVETVMLHHAENPPPASPASMIQEAHQAPSQAG